MLIITFLLYKLLRPSFNYIYSCFIKKILINCSAEGIILLWGSGWEEQRERRKEEGSREGDEGGKEGLSVSGGGQGRGIR